MCRAFGVEFARHAVARHGAALLVVALRET
jgi:hypothetical protein